MKEKSNYIFWHNDQVRFNDLDALGHVSSVTMNEYFAGVRTKLFRESIYQWPQCQTVPVLRSSTTEYLSEVIFPSNLEVGLKIEQFGTTSFTLQMGLFVEHQCKAICKNTFVMFNRDTKKKATMSKTIKTNFLKRTE